MAVYVGDINEATTGRYTATMYDETGAVIDGTALTTLTLTLYDKKTGTVINSRNALNALNANGVAVTSAGALTWTIAKEDTIVVGTAQMEWHVAVFSGTWSSGAKRFVHEIEMRVVNIKRVV